MNLEEITKKEGEIRELVLATIDKAAKHGIDQVEIFCSHSSSTDISLEKNDINTSTYSEETMYGLRVIAGHCQGFAATNDPATLFDSVLEAKALALSQGTPDDAMELPEKDQISEVKGLYHPAIDEITPKMLLGLVMASLEQKNKQFPKVNIDSGEFALSKGLKMVASSKGVFASEKEAVIYASFMGMAVDGEKVGSFDYDSAYGRQLADFQTDFNEVYTEFMENCMHSLNAQAIQGFKGKVIIPPKNISGFLLGDLLSSLTASMIRKGKSKFGDKKGTAVASPLLSVTDNPLKEGFMSSTAFDREGQSTSKKDVLKNGILENFFYNHFEAKKAGLKRSGGSALGGASSTPSCGPRQLDVAAGGTPLEEIMQSDKAIILSRFSGSTDSASGDFSGVVKGGFLVEKGEKIPVKEIQIAGNIYQSLKDISAVSRERKTLHTSSVMPWVVLENIDITGI